jgi:Fe-S-cluster containining protein
MTWRRGKTLTESKSLNKLYKIANFLSNQEECKTCRLCEDNIGLVYVLNLEAKAIGREHIVTTSAGINFFVRTSDNHCPYFEKESGTCNIYEKRPLCCRLYPLDLLFEDGEYWWIAYSDCPIFKRYEKNMSLNILRNKLLSLEYELDLETLKELKNIAINIRSIESIGRENFAFYKLKKLNDKEIL